MGVSIEIITSSTRSSCSATCLCIFSYSVNFELQILHRNIRSSWLLDFFIGKASWKFSPNFSANLELQGASGLYLHLVVWASNNFSFRNFFPQPRMHFLALSEWILTCCCRPLKCVNAKTTCQGNIILGLIWGFYNQNPNLGLLHVCIWIYNII